MYFAVLGKHHDISLKELEAIQPQNITKLQKNLIAFDTTESEKLKDLAGIIKRGIIIPKEELGSYLEGQKIVGASSITLGKTWKKEFRIKRFKLTSLSKTDLDIKKKGVEVVSMPQQDRFGIVQGYQNIPLYESIDFGKPYRSMEMGMMPAKLTHIMLNLGLAITGNQDITIYDPFVGSGTTGFLANALGYDVIGSDIDIKPMKRNYQRWKTSKRHQAEQSFDFREQDIHNPFPDLPKNTLIISEGWLGPIVKERTSSAQIKDFQNQVLTLYKAFFTNIAKQKTYPMVITIPYYLNHHNTLEAELQDHTTKLGRNFDSIPEVYHRPNQKVGRKILLLS